jgi:UDP-glucose:(heptosyl)LPS alpha-1,3-glucosyltransferase
VTVLCRTHGAPPHPNVKFETLRGLSLGSGFRHASFAKASARYLSRYQDRYDVVLGLGRTPHQDVLRVGGGCHETLLEAAGIRRRSLKDRTYIRLQAASVNAPGNKKVVANSHMVADDLKRRYGLANEKLGVIHNGVDLARFSFESLRESAGALRARLGFGKEDIVFCFVGTGFARKGLDLILKAFSRLHPRDSRCHLLVVGEDSAADRYHALARKFGCSDRVRFLGGRDDPEVCMAAADVFVLPTRYDPFANVTLEALACGLPVITTHGNGGSEVLNDEAGTVIDHRCEASLEQAMADWCGGTRLRVGRQSARAVAEQHAIDQKIDQMVALLEWAAD